MSAHAFSVYDIIKRNALLFPDKTAIVDGEKNMTFQDLLIHVNSLASALDCCGIKPRQSIAILSMNRIEYLVLYGAAAAVGAMLLPLNWRLSTDELAYILKDSGSGFLFFDSSQQKQAYALKESSGFDGKLIFFDDHNYDHNYKESQYDIDPFTKGQAAIDAFSEDKAGIDTETLEKDKDLINAKMLNYSELVQGRNKFIQGNTKSSTGIASSPEIKSFATDKRFQIDTDDIFALIYTAAVAGKPRGAALSHSNIIAGNMQTCLTMNIGKDDAYLNMLPLFHITGMNLSLAVMHMGGKNVIMEKFDAQQALAMVEKEKITLMASFPPILTTLMDEIDRGKPGAGERGTDKNIDSCKEKMPEPSTCEAKAESRKFSYDLSSLKNTVGIDSPDNILKFREKTSSSFWVLYGQSETSGFVTLSDSSESPGSAGRQCCISDMAIVDENDVILPSGQSGEIAVRGHLVFQGFWRGGYKSCEKESGGTDHKGYDTSSIRNGWHHTGDTGHIDSDGYLWFEGRKPEKELIKPGGENVYPAEVESVVLAHPDIEQTCVIGVPDPKFGEGVKAVCVRKGGSDLSERDLIEFVGARIARYKKPGYVAFIDTMPSKADGSVDRMKVKELYGR
ncbi:MAG: AMP-binding protein [Desulfamplus sp.]|nr:AMP-binding protein [Desulfamplus sp.]